MREKGSEHKKRDKGEKKRDRDSRVRPEELIHDRKEKDRRKTILRSKLLTLSTSPRI